MKKDDPQSDGKDGMQVDHGRRSAVRKIVVSVGVLTGMSVLPEQWTRPIIGQIFLPAHAATSGSALHDPCTVERRIGDQTTATVVIKVTGYVTPPTANLSVLVTAQATGGANATETGKTTTDTKGNFEAFITIGGGPGINKVDVTTDVTGADGVAQCSVTIPAPSPPATTPASPTTGPPD